MNSSIELWFVKDGINLALILFIPIMRTALNNFNLIIFNAVNYTIAFVYMPVPISLQISGKRFRFADSRITVPVNIFIKNIDSFQGLFILCLPE